MLSDSQSPWECRWLSSLRRGHHPDEYTALHQLWVQIPFDPFPALGSLPYCQVTNINKLAFPRSPSIPCPSLAVLCSIKEQNHGSERSPKRLFVEHNMKSESEVAQSCPSLCDPMDCSLPGFSIHGILQARILEWVTISFSRGSSKPRDWTQVSRIGGRRFNLWTTREYNIRHFKRMCPDFKSSVEEQKGPHLKLNELGAHPSWQYELREVDPFFDSCFLHLLIWSNDNAAHLMGSLWKVIKTLCVNMSGGDDSYFCNLPPSYCWLKWLRWRILWTFYFVEQTPGQVVQANPVLIKPYSSHK